MNSTFSMAATTSLVLAMCTICCPPTLNHTLTGLLPSLMALTIVSGLQVRAAPILYLSPPMILLAISGVIGSSRKKSSMRPVSGSTQVIMLPGRSMLPARPMRQVIARSVWPQFAWRSSELPTWMQPGVSTAHISAAVVTCSFGIQQMSETFSGVKSLTRSRSSSNPNVQFSTNSLSQSSCSMMWFIIPMARAQSVPTRGWIQSEAREAYAVARGSMMMRFLQ